VFSAAASRSEHVQHFADKDSCESPRLEERFTPRFTFGRRGPAELVSRVALALLADLGHPAAKSASKPPAPPPEPPISTNELIGALDAGDEDPVVGVPQSVG
jgi:hypothetical protein